MLVALNATHPPHRLSFATSARPVPANEMLRVAAGRAVNRCLWNKKAMPDLQLVCESLLSVC
jgi:hypothetical protein